jgi:hypothetical protein
MTSSRAAHGGLGGVPGVGDVSGWAQPGAGGDQRSRNQLAQQLRRGDQQRVELIGGQLSSARQPLGVVGNSRSPPVAPSLGVAVNEEWLRRE